MLTESAVGVGESAQAQRSRSRHSRFDALVVGGSTGGIQALNELLPPLTRELEVAVVIAVHVPARVPSLLVPIYERRCSLPVREALDKQPVSPCTIWFAPPDYHLMIERTHTFALSLDEPVNFSRPSIDVLFESAAWAYGPRVLGVILSGASRDGSQGALTLRERGGVLAVQDPACSE
ncbi:MAG TPA: chemotaxis protein CheB, partial [Polyangiaceae bacterium]|nr:chemotaxis protein CheB [Polyangiaceae bacterium]